MIKTKRSFEQWFQVVDAVVMRLCGLSVHDLPDCCYRDWYEDGMSPSAAARKAIRCVDGEY